MLRVERACLVWCLAVLIALPLFGCADPSSPNRAIDSEGTRATAPIVAGEVVPFGAVRMDSVAPVRSHTAPPLSQSARTPGALDIRQRLNPTTVVHGRLVVVAVEARGELPTDGVLRAQLDDGRTVSAVIRWIGVLRENVYTDDRVEPGMRTWLAGTAGSSTWLVLNTTQQPPRDADGSYVVFAEIPVNAYGQGVWIEGTRCDLAWVADPALRSSTGEDHAWQTFTDPNTIESGPLYELTEPARESPLSRWRVRLVYEGLRPIYSMLDHAGPSIDPAGRLVAITDTQPFVGWRRFEHPELEAIALQLEGQWQTGLARLAQADRAVYQRTFEQLGAIATFSSLDGVIHAPVWREDPIQTDELLRSLNRTTTRDDEMVSEVVGWLERQPSMLVAIEDDGGRPATEPGGATVQMGLLRTRSDNAVVVAASAGANAPSSPVAVEPWIWQSVEVPVGVTSITRALNDAGGEPARAQVAIEARADRQRAWAPARPAKLRAEPPFLALGPMMGVRSLSDLYTTDAGAAIFPGIPGGTTIHLQKTSVELTGDRAAERGAAIEAPGGARSWRLFIQCDALEASLDPHDSVRVWFGPTGTARLALAIDRVGGVRHALDENYITDHGVVVVQGERKWTCILTVPESCIEVDGTLRIGIERTSRTGRSSLGRSVFPWQREPGRIAVDTLAWK